MNWVNKTNWQNIIISSRATLKETFTAKYNEKHPKWDQNPKFTPLRETTSIPAPFKWSPPGQPARITAIKFLSATKQLVAQVIVALVVEQGALIIAAVLLLCQLCRYVLLKATQALMNYAPCTVVKFLHFLYLFVQAIARLHVIVCVTVTAVHNANTSPLQLALVFHQFRRKRLAKWSPASMWIWRTCHQSTPFRPSRSRKHSWTGA